MHKRVHPKLHPGAPGPLEAVAMLRCEGAAQRTHARRADTYVARGQQAAEATTASWLLLLLLLPLLLHQRCPGRELLR